MKQWQRPNTTRTYLHPPKSERMVTLWREGKLMLGQVELEPGPIVITNYVPGSGADESSPPLDPWFAPWSPNASANGRLLILLDMLAKEK